WVILRDATEGDFVTRNTASQMGQRILWPTFDSGTLIRFSHFGQLRIKPIVGPSSATSCLRAFRQNHEDVEAVPRGLRRPSRLAPSTPGLGGGWRVEGKDRTATVHFSHHPPPSTRRAGVEPEGRCPQGSRAALSSFPNALTATVACPFLTSAPKSSESR